MGVIFLGRPSCVLSCAVMCSSSSLDCPTVAIQSNAGSTQPAAAVAAADVPSVDELREQNQQLVRDKKVCTSIVLQSKINREAFLAKALTRN